MSNQNWIEIYYNEIDRIHQFGGKNESALKDEFKQLLNKYCRGNHLLLIAELERCYSRRIK